MNTSRLVAMLAGVASALVLVPANARDDRMTFPVADAMTTDAARSALSSEIRMFFGDAAHPAVERSFGIFTSNKKTNAVGKSDKLACEWAFLSAMKSFQERAVREGGNAVINIRSIYKGKLLTSVTDYECGAGNIMVGVTFKGEVVKLDK